jgi:lipopolysaccharide transport system ATP-binding protein
MEIQFGGETHAVPRGAVVGVIGDQGVSEMLQAAGGRFIGPGHELDLSPAPLICLAYVLDLRDAVVRAQTEARFEELRRAGTSVLLASFHAPILRNSADEVWWVREGRVEQKGDPGEVLDAYSRHVVERLRSMPPPAFPPSLRRGDGRAELVSIEAPGSVVSGSPMEIRITVRFHAAVEDPVIGIMIRTRIGMEVYGTNTELEHVRIGPCQANDSQTVRFRFACNLCPQTYTLTAASHDPDGVWHDWIEDGVAFQVTDTRYTAGVANLRAEVTCSRG